MAPVMYTLRLLENKHEVSVAKSAALQTVANAGNYIGFSPNIVKGNMVMAVAE